MSFWDGTQWVNDVTSPPARPSTRWRDLIATATMVIIAGALVLPFTATLAGDPTPSIAVSSTSGPVGASISIAGTGFAARSRVQLTWDTSDTGLPDAVVNARGRFKVSITIPKAGAGDHKISAVVGSGRKVTTADVGTILASTVFRVTAAQATPAPTAAPTAKPTPAPTAAPTPAPTAAPTPKPTPSTAPTVAPTSAPTVAPTSTPAVTPAPTVAPTSTPGVTPAPTAAPTATPAVTVAPTTAPTPTPAPTAAPTAAPTPTPVPTATPTAVPTPTPVPSAPIPSPTPAPIIRTVLVTSIAALRTALADDAVDEIVVANGTYHVSPSNQFRANSLWIGGPSHPAFDYAKRTRPITVRAETRGGVTFDGGGGSGFGGLSFEDGAHHQTWDGFRFANMAASSTGIIEVGGYSPRRTPHHITLRNITILGTCTGRATTASGNNLEHGVYVAHSQVDGPHDLLFENFSVSGAGHLASAFHFYHGDAANPGAHDVTIRNLTVSGTQTAIFLWEETLRNVTIDGFTSTAAMAYAIRYEPYGDDDLSSGPHASGMVVKNSTSVGPHSSGYPGGLESSQGANPIGMSFTNNDLH